MIGAPPFDAGADHVTAAVALPADADTPVGTPGTVNGVALADTSLGRLSPTPVVATTVTV